MITASEAQELSSVNLDDLPRVEFLLNCIDSDIRRQAYMHSDRVYHRTELLNQPEKEQMRIALEAAEFQTDFHLVEGEDFTGRSEYEIHISW
jgi:hypothetical protein